MINKHTILLALLVPGLAMLAACNRNDADAAAAPVSTTTPAPADSMSAPPMPADTMPAMGDGMSFSDMDKNRDGGVTLDEMSDADMLHQHFSVADTNGDNKLSEAEITKHRADMAAAPAN